MASRLLLKSRRMTRAPIAVSMLLAGGAVRAAVAPSTPQQELKSVADRWHSTVIEVRARATIPVVIDSAQQIVEMPSFGTGVLIGDGLALTMLHSVGVVLPGRVGAWSDVLAFVPGVGPMAAQIAAFFPELDLAVLRVAVATSINAAPLATDLPVPGEPLIAMGVGDDAVNAIGVTVAGVSRDYLILVSNRRLDSRYWGGPLFDGRGRLVGIIASSVLPRAVTSVALRDLIDRVRQR